jgi:predicted flap endonuclease-1-like 5' DNA nuclease
MTFASAVFWSIFFLVVAAILGGLIIYFMLQRRLSVLAKEVKALKKGHKTLEDKVQLTEKELNLEIMARDKKIATAKTALEQAKEDCEQSQVYLKDTIQNQDKNYLILKAEYDSLKSTAERVQADLQAQSADTHKKMNQLRADYDNIKLKLESVAAVGGSIDQHPTYLTLQAEFFAFRAKSEQANEALRAALQSKEQETADLQAQLADESGKTDSKSDKKEAQLAQLREKAKSFDYSRIGVASAQEKDDLKIILGIGPFIEEKLNALGIYTFVQISKFTEEDIEKVTEAIAFFPGRIQRDKWIVQAAEFVKNPPAKS